MNELTLFYVALVKKINLKCLDNREQYDIAFAKATSEAEAVDKITEMDWEEPWYEKGKSTTCVVQIWLFSDVISGKHVKMARNAEEMRELDRLRQIIAGKGEKGPRVRRRARQTAPEAPETARRPPRVRRRRV